MHIYNPKNFDPSTILTGYRLEEYLRLFVHIVIATHSKYNKSESEMVPLHALTLRKQVHRGNTEAIREALIHNKVIECDKTFCPDEKCYNFRLGEKYRNQHVVRLPISLTKRRTNLLKERGGLLNDKPDFEEGNKAVSAHKAIWRWLNATTIDYEKAKDWLEKHDTNNLTQKWFTLEKMKVKDWFFHVDERGRVYHNVACMWSQFRQFLYIDGKKLVNIDIRNSQPLFFAIKLKEHYNPYYYPLLYYRGAQTSRSSLELDVAMYISLVERGELYDYLMGEWGYRNRSHFKKKFFAEIFYSKPNTKHRLTKQFQDLFPNVFKVICHEKKDDYRQLPLAMQRIEADLMIGNVGVRLAKEGIPFLTIHDSILTIPEYVITVKKFIREAFSEWGLSPTLT